MCDACTPATTAPLREAFTRRRFLRDASLLALVPLAPAAAGEQRRLRVIPRRAWGARPVQGTLERHRIRRITVHHSAVVLRDNRDAPSRFRDHQAAHIAKGWPDIAYHLLIDRNGNLYEGRPRWAAGDTSTDYDPSGHLLVLCEGNFERQDVARAQLSALVDVLVWGTQRYDVARRRVRYHGYYAATACPGADLRARFTSGRIGDKMANRAGIDYDLETMSLEEGRRRVARIEGA